LEADDKVEVIAAARNPKKAASLGIPVVRLDLDQPETIAPALQGVDRAFLLTRRRPVTISREYSQKSIGQPFSYEARPPEEFYRNVLAAGAEPSYMKCVFDSYTDYTAGRIPHSDDVFDNLPAIAGRKPITLAEFAKKHANKFRY
jgi:hypothetical protein